MSHLSHRSASGSHPTPGTTENADIADTVGAVFGHVPAGWSRAQDCAAELVGPAYAHGRAAVVRVVIARDAAGLETATDVLVERLRTQRPDRLVAGCDIWPHPSFGEGRVVQTAYISGDDTLAHDVHVFVHAGLRVQIEVECALVDLLTVEEQVAAIVAGIRLDEEVVA